MDVQISSTNCWGSDYHFWATLLHFKHLSLWFELVLQIPWGIKAAVLEGRLKGWTRSVSRNTSLGHVDHKPYIIPVFVSVALFWVNGQRKRGSNENCANCKKCWDMDQNKRNFFQQSSAWFSKNSGRGLTQQTDTIYDTTFKRLSQRTENCNLDQEPVF